MSIDPDRRYLPSQFAQIVENEQIDEEPETSLAESVDGPVSRLLACLEGVTDRVNGGVKVLAKSAGLGARNRQTSC